MEPDAIVIGSGQAGVPLATRLAEAGRSVLLVERKSLGGTCVNYGCTPTKTMIASARAAHVARRAGRLGVRTGEVTVDLAAVVDRKDEIVRQWREGVEARVADAGRRLTLERGHARFVGEREIEVGGRRHRAETVVVNVGARPVVPPLEGLDAVPWLDNTRAMELRELPRRLVVIGGGYIACELGQMFRRLGAEVAILQRGKHLLDREDPDVSEAIEEAFRDEGIELRLGVEAEAVSAAADGVRVKLKKGGTVDGSHLLIAVGRRANTDDLGCEAAGIELDAAGAIRVDAGYRTTAEGVYAVGDAIGGPQFTHVSWDDHRILYDILMGRRERTREGRHVPYCVFTDPQVARVGLDRREAKRLGIACEAADMPFGDIARAIETGETRGLLRVLIDPDSERVLGATIVGAEAGELVHVFVALMQAGAPARALVDAQAIHPTLAEGLQSVLMRLDRFGLA